MHHVQGSQLRFWNPIEVAKIEWRCLGRGRLMTSIGRGFFEYRVNLFLGKYFSHRLPARKPILKPHLSRRGGLAC